MFSGDRKPPESFHSLQDPKAEKVADEQFHVLRARFEAPWEIEIEFFF